MGIPLDVTEWMKGYIGRGATDCDAGFIQGIEADTPFAHHVVIHMPDIDRFVDEPTHSAAMDGWVESPLFGGRRLVTGGMFNMLVGTTKPELKVMLYRLPFTDDRGRIMTMLGHKTLHRDNSRDLWYDITRLSIRIFDGDVPGPDVSTPAMGPARMTTPTAMGILHIETEDSLRSAGSFTSPGASPLELAAAVAKFVDFYADGLKEVFSRHSPFFRALVDMSS
jgi:cholesterol oxidase